MSWLSIGNADHYCNSLVCGWSLTNALQMFLRRELALASDLRGGCWESSPSIVECNGWHDFSGLSFFRVTIFSG